MKKRLCLIISIFLIGINLVYAKEKVAFVKCVDGDTFRVMIDEEEKLVRMLAIDTPEIAKNGKRAEYYAEEASNYTCDKITKAKKIELEYDSNSDKTDKYGRVLAWVYVDGKLLQDDLVADGYAKVAYLYADYKYTDILKEKQELASAKEIGIWDSEAKKEYDDSEIVDGNTIEEASNGIVVIVGIIILGMVFIFDKIFNKKK